MLQVSKHISSYHLFSHLEGRFMKSIIFSLTAALLTTTAWADSTPKVQGLYQQNFTSPSGNIICGGDVRAGFSAIEPQEGVFCFIHSEIQNAQPKPRDCELDWQATFVLPAKGKPEVVWECAGDTPYGTPQTLPYGNSIKGKGWECSSNMSGMLCTNQSGNGFKLNRQEQTLF